MPAARGRGNRRWHGRTGRSRRLPVSLGPPMVGEGKGKMKMARAIPAGAPARRRRRAAACHQRDEANSSTLDRGRPVSSRGGRADRSEEGGGGEFRAATPAVPRRRRAGRAPGRLSAAPRCTGERGGRGGGGEGEEVQSSHGESATSRPSLQCPRRSPAALPRTE